jgi:hypothetical protein
MTKYYCFIKCDAMQLVTQSVSQSVCLSVSQSICQSACLSVGQSVDQLVCQ